MIVSFDIDDTLIPCNYSFELEKPTFKSRFLRAEPLRKGTVELFSILLKKNIEIWIYTTSFRSVFHL